MATKTENRSRAAIAREACDYRRDLTQVAENVLGARLTAAQQHILRVMSAHGARLAVRTGHGVGKTYAAACLVLSFVASHPGSRAITTAPTWLQVRDLLWAEISALHRRARLPLGGAISATRWRLAEDWFAVGLSTDEAERFQGRHAPHVLVVFDEAPGVRDAVWLAAESLMAGEDARWLAIGNPTRPRDRFAECFRPDSDWETLRISCLEAPNVTGEAHIPGGVTSAWINRMRSTWGEGSALFRSRVLGEFPLEEEDALIPHAFVTAAQARTARGEGAPRLGVDVARYGKDFTALVVRRGARIERIETLARTSVIEAADRVKRLAREFGVAPGDIAVDDTGLGGGVTDLLDDHFRPRRVRAVNFGARAFDTDRFENARAELYWRLRDALDPLGPRPLALPPEEAALADELAIRFRLTARGRIAVEPKDRLRARLGRSPDRADALALSFARGPLAPAATVL